MRRTIYVSSLTAGRCFSYAEPPTQFDDANPNEKVTAARSILTADQVFKYLGPVEGGIEVESARGERSVLAENTKVVEQPRQGWDRLVERLRTEPSDTP